MAGRIPSAFIDNLLTGVDIVEVISQFVPLQKKGQEYMACCPFHEEKTPSFSVSPQKQLYYCFGCNVGGNVTKFLMEYSNIGFVDAIETLAKIANVDVPREGGDPAADEEYKSLFDVLSKAAGLYRKSLGRAKHAVDYLARRGIEENTAEVFGIGYAPDGFDNLKRFFGREYNERLLLKAGLVAKKDDKPAYDRFRQRLMFPIRDRQGRTIAFGGRVLQAEGQPKYLNSPETALFKKSRTIYGAYEIRKCRKLDSVLVVEGYMDVVSLFNHGIENVVATLGTAFTKEHVHQLFQLCDKLVFCFDGDLAGQKAAVSALEQVLPAFHEGKTVEFMFLPEQEDPDSFVQKHGRREFEKAIAQATPLSLFMFDHLRAGLDLSIPEVRAKFATRARPMLGSLPQGTMRELLTEQLAQKAGMAISHLQAVSTKKQRPFRQQSLPTGRGNYRERQYSMARVAAALLLSTPSFAELVDLPCDEIRAIDLPEAGFLADLIEYCRQVPGATMPVLFERYRGGDYEQLFIQLSKMPLSGNKEEEFRQSTARLTRYLETQRFDELIKKMESGELDETEQGLLQTYIDRQK